ncbi:Microtubule-associated protein 9 [Aphelenchoides bicaudatus]|nr:Microtubule-associated protein 9 [Aphelenchoides bicaudatus]
MLDRKSTSSSTNKQRTEQLPSKTIESNEQQNGTIRSRPPANISTNRLTQRPRSSTQRPRPEIDIQRSKLKSSMSTRQLLQDNSPNYNLWLQRSLENQKRKNAEERAKKAAEEEKKAEQKANADKAFERWKARYDEKQVKEQRQRKKTAQEQAEEKKRLLDEKRRNAEKTFEHWKKSQDERRKSEELRRKRLDRERAQSVELQKQNQRRENEKAYQEDQKIRDAAEYERRTKLEQDRSFKDSLAKEAYQLWLEMKRKEKTYQHSLAYKILDYNAEAKKRWPAVPWLPTTPTVPRRFVGTGNRRRTLDKPLTIVQRRAKSVY